MAITVKYDLLPSTQTKGVLSSDYDRAEVVAFVEGINNDNKGVGTAIDAVIADAARRYHQSNDTLPLQYVSARRFGQTSANLVLHYGRRRFRSFPQSPLKVASFRSAEWSTQWYRLPYDTYTGQPRYDAGVIPTNTALVVPNGRMQFHNSSGNPNIDLDPAAKPKDWMWTQNAVRMSVPAILPNNPLQRVANKLNRINSSAVLYGGMKFPRDTLLFKGIDVEWEAEVNGALSFYVSYEFLHVSHGFVMQNATFSTAPTSQAPFWHTESGLAYEEVSMTGFDL